MFDSPDFLLPLVPSPTSFVHATTPYVLVVAQKTERLSLAMDYSFYQYTLYSVETPGTEWAVILPMT